MGQPAPQLYGHLPLLTRHLPIAGCVVLRKLPLIPPDVQAGEGSVVRAHSSRSVAAFERPVALLLQLQRGGGAHAYRQRRVREESRSLLGDPPLRACRQSRLRSAR
jgi:hypothetical protein